ncbi:gliding motility-associated C-terminal domain-containing protein [Flavobacteriales bacterium]|nr:gliding motility-associated C-terminal domain-containing protein [Flavobacteriales bacterium]
MRKSILLLIASIFTLNLYASHFIGGEITWECDNNPISPNFGKYTFYMHIYQDCDGIDFSFFSEDLTVHNHPSLSVITLNFLDTNDISSSGIAGAATCYNCDNQPFGEFGAVKEWIYSSGPISINGTPPANGWHFTWGTCCRSSQLTQGMADDDWTLRSVMYPYTDLSGTIFPNSNMCHDNSPIFKENPKSLLCTGYPFSYSHLAFDVELDSLSYSWAEPLGSNFNYDPNNPTSIALVFDPPYAVNSPIPGNPTLDPENGEISFNSNIAGIFVTCVKVSSFKCGQLVAEVFRDVNVALKSCGTLPNGAQNSPPVITPPLGTQDWITNLNPSTGLPSYETTIMAGELVAFSVIATDNDINVTGNMQEISLEVEGGQLDPILALSNIATFTVTSSSPGSTSGEFLWQSNCDHMQDYGCGLAGGAFTFNLKAYDDFCPANGIVIATISINVIPPQPDLRCIAVDSAGGINLFYSFPEGVVDTNIRYDIYYSKDLSGPYALIDSVFFPDTTYFHAASTADVSKSYYFLLGNISCGSSLGGSDSLLYSDTLSSILMEVTEVDLGVSADLAWNEIHTPLLSSSDLEYDLHYINSYDIDVILSSLADLFYEIDGDNCDYYPEFYVEIADESGCSSRSSIGLAHLQDTITPVTPIIKDVSVANSGEAVISWLPSPDSESYIIFIQADDGAWLTLDTVTANNISPTYIYDNSDAVNGSESFSVRAIDSCGNTRIRSLTHNSIFLTSSYDVCDYSMFLDWNKYINWNNGVSHYKVFVEERDSNNLIILNSEIRVSEDTELLINNITSLSNYVVYIEAYNDDSTFIARSNVLDINVELPRRPLFNYLQYATINHDNGCVEINCLVDNDAVIDHYDIYRTADFDINDVGINFSKIDEVDFSGNEEFFFNDKDAHINTTSYRYKVYPIDTCGVSQLSPPVNDASYFADDWFAQTILLDVKKNIDYSEIIPTLSEAFTNTIFFNKYSKWLGGVLRYELYRSVNNEPYNVLPNLLDVQNNLEELTFIDIVTNEGKNNAKFCYYVKAIEGTTDSTVYMPAVSYSNIVCVYQTPLIYMPNIFTPNNDGDNDLLMPETYFVSEVGYSFSIYSRKGEEIFKTKMPSKGWDGTFRGEEVQNDNYVYYLEYMSGDGVLIEKTGIISLVR